MAESDTSRRCPKRTSLISASTVPSRAVMTAVCGRPAASEPEVGRSVALRELSDRSAARRPGRWAYRPGPGRRDARLDLLRGFAVFAMVVDHFGGKSWLTLLTGGNEFLVSAAEGFVFLSGFVMGMVY